MCAINVFILPHTDPTGSWRQLVSAGFYQHDLIPSPTGTPVKPCGALPSKWGPLSPSPRAPRKEREEKRSKGHQGRDKETVRSHGGPGFPPRVPHPLGSPPPRPASPSRCRQQNCLTDLGLPQEDQHRRSSLLFFRECLCSRGLWVLPPTGLADAPPPCFGLRGPCLAFDEEVVAAAPPALV